MKKKWTKIACISVVIVVIVVISIVLGVQAADRRRWEEERDNTSNLIIEAVSKVASEYSLTSEFVRFENLEGYDRLVYVQVNDFKRLSPEEMGDFFEKLGRIHLTDSYFSDLDDMDLTYDKHLKTGEDMYGGALIILSDGEEYCFNLEGAIDITVYRGADKSVIYEHERSSNNTDNTGTKGEKCPRCNGTGSVKYYYGGSTLEAILNGHEDSWYGQCGSCGGDGYKD